MRLFLCSEGKICNLPAVKKIDRIGRFQEYYVMHPHIIVEMTDRPNITQNIIITMSNNEIIIEMCRKLH